MKRRWVICFVIVAFCMGVLSGRFWLNWKFHQLLDGIEYGYEGSEKSSYDVMVPAECFISHVEENGVAITCNDKSKMPVKYWLDPWWYAQRQKQTDKEVEEREKKSGGSKIFQAAKYIDDHDYIVEHWFYAHAVPNALICYRWYRETYVVSYRWWTWHNWITRWVGHRNWDRPSLVKYDCGLSLG